MLSFTNSKVANIVNTISTSSMLLVAGSVENSSSVCRIFSTLSIQTICNAGRVIKALNNNWHPLCFRCEACQIPLADQGFIKNAGRALCHECNAREKAAAIGKYICFKCHTIVDEGAPLKFKVSMTLSAMVVCNRRYDRENPTILITSTATLVELNSTPKPEN